MLNEFYRAVTSLKSKKEVEKFFTDLLDVGEIVMLSRRILAAEKLHKGETFDEISRELKMGKDTIMRVSHWLENGHGYKLVIGRLKRVKK